MHRCLPTSLLVAVLSACTIEVDQNTNDPSMCPEKTYEDIESRIKISDPEGHGPDLGSPEWMSAVERQLGIDNTASVPKRDTGAWCAYISEQIQPLVR